MPAKATLGPPSPASLAPTENPITRCLAGFLLPNFRQKKASDYAGLGVSYESGRVRGHFGVMGNQRNKSVLLAVGKLTEALQQFALVQ